MKKVSNSNNLDDTSRPAPEGANPLFNGMQVQQGNSESNTVRTGEGLNNPIVIEDRNIQQGAQVTARSANDAFGDRGGAKKPRVAQENSVSELVPPVLLSSVHKQHNPTHVQLYKRVEGQRLPVASSDPLQSGKTFYDQFSIHFQKREYYQAQKAFQSCMAYPQFTRSLKPFEYGTFYQQVSIVYNALGDRTNEKKFLEQGLACFNDSGQAQDLVSLGNMYYYLGDLCRFLNDNEGVIRAYTKCLTTPGYKEKLGFVQLGNLYCYLGDVYTVLKRNQEVIEAYKNCLAVAGYKEMLQPNQLGNLYYRLHVAYCFMNDHKGVIQNFENYIVIPQDKKILDFMQLGNLYRDLGDAYVISKENKEAIEAYTSCLVIPGYKEKLTIIELGKLYYKLGDAYFFFDKYGEAKYHYTICLNLSDFISSLEPVDKRTFYRLFAFACCKTNNYGGSKKYLEICLNNIDYIVDVDLRLFHQMKICHELYLCYNQCDECLDGMVYIMIGLIYGNNIPDSNETKAAILSSYENLNDSEKIKEILKKLTYLLEPNVSTIPVEVIGRAIRMLLQKIS